MACIHSALFSPEYLSEWSTRTPPKKTILNTLEAELVHKLIFETSILAGNSVRWEAPSFPWERIAIPTGYLIEALPIKNNVLLSLKFTKFHGKSDKHTKLVLFCVRNPKKKKKKWKIDDGTERERIKGRYRMIKSKVIGNVGRDQGETTMEGNYQTL